MFLNLASSGLLPSWFKERWVNILWPSDTMCHQTLWSTLFQAVACCLMAPRLYLDQCSLIVKEWHWPEGNFTGYAQDIYPWYQLENWSFLPLGPKAGGVLSLPASVRLSVCLSVCPSVCLSVCLSVRPYDHACPRDNSKNIFQIFSKLAWNILWVNISDKFDDGYRSSLNMRIIDQKVTLTFFEFLK